MGELQLRESAQFAEQKFSELNQTNNHPIERGIAGWYCRSYRWGKGKTEDQGELL
jgi:hypothetical protein